MTASAGGPEAVADPKAGLARFDGLVIETDSFLDPRRDRVMPILLEEQVFMCRQMRGTVLALREECDRGLAVLDVGAGSGVFGIYLDRLLNGSVADDASESEFSSITAVDISPRAVEFIRKNAEVNGARNVRAVLEPYTTATAAPDSQDIIIINPPYHPVIGEWAHRVAIHAAAGEDGLGVLRQWKAALAGHLRPGGYLIGSIMSPVRDDGSVVALEEIHEELGGRSTIRYCRHLDDPDPGFGGFLSSVYRDHLQDDPELEEWIESLTAAALRVTVVYFEARKEGRPSGILPDLEKIGQTGSVSWADRAEAHRLITNRTSAM